jgi:hypothetical protein
MFPLIEALAMQKEREIAMRTRAPLFTHQSAGGSVRRSRVRRPEGGLVRVPKLSLPPLSPGKWRHWAARPDVHCSRSASLAGC